MGREKKEKETHSNRAECNGYKSLLELLSKNIMNESQSS